MTIRNQAIACITEKLRELAGIENALHANHTRATKEIGGMSYQTYADHREAAELHYVTADYYELLIEAITAIPLFDELDAQFPRNVASTEHVDYAEAAAVREIERELDVWAGDDSELDAQIAADDARAERAAALEFAEQHDPALTAIPKGVTA